jgi:hypothetical protein
MIITRGQQLAHAAGRSDRLRKKDLAEEHRQVPSFSYGAPAPLTPNGNFFRYPCKFIISRSFSGNFFR